MLDRDSQIPLYQQIAGSLRAQIESGELSPGDQFPTEHDLISAYGVARTTARRAIRELRDARLAYAINGEGVFVGADEASAPRALETLPPYGRIAADMITRIESGEWRRRLPSEPDLMDIYDAARDTVRQALAVLRYEGRVVTQPRRGTWISDDAE